MTRVQWRVASFLGQGEQKYLQRWWLKKRSSLTMFLLSKPHGIIYFIIKPHGIIYFIIKPHGIIYFIIKPSKLIMYLTLIHILNQAAWERAITLPHSPILWIICYKNIFILTDFFIWLSKPPPPPLHSRWLR